MNVTLSVCFFQLTILVMMDRCNSINCRGISSCACASICELNCQGNNDCSQSTLTCSANSQCTVNCGAFDSCWQATINCEAGATCNINCAGTSIDDGSCMDSEVYCQDNSNCNIYCGDAAMYNNCDGMKVYATEASSLSMTCGSCDSMHVECPYNEEIAPNTCSFSSVGTASHIAADILIHSYHGIDGLDINGFGGNSNNFARVYCGDSYLTEAPTTANCLVNSDGTLCSPTASYCAAGMPTNRPTLSPTNNPTTVSTQNPSTYPTNNPTNNPSIYPTNNPSEDPTNNPTYNPSKYPTDNPSEYPTYNPSTYPTNNPTMKATTMSTSATPQPTTFTLTAHIKTSGTESQISSTKLNDGNVGMVGTDTSSASTTEKFNSGQGRQAKSNLFEIATWSLAGLLAATCGFIACVFVMVRCRKQKRNVHGNSARFADAHPITMGAEMANNMQSNDICTDFARVKSVSSEMFDAVAVLENNEFVVGGDDYEMETNGNSNDEFIVSGDDEFIIPTKSPDNKRDSNTIKTPIFGEDVNNGYEEHTEGDEDEDIVLSLNGMMTDLGNGNLDNEGGHELNSLDVFTIE